MVVSRCWNRVERSEVVARRPGLLRWCRRWVGSDQDAEELANEALAVWVQRRDQIAPHASDAWIYGTARNLCRNFLRKRRAELAHDGAWVEDQPEVGPTAEERLSADRDTRAMAEALRATYGEPAVSAVSLLVEGHSYAEIGAALGDPDPERVRALLQKARRLLRARFDRAGR